MPGIDAVGKVMAIAGTVLLALGGILMAVGRFTSLGRLPGDIFLQRDHVSFYFPVVTMILISVILTIVLNVVLRLLNR